MEARNSDSVTRHIDGRVRKEKTEVTLNFRNWRRKGNAGKNSGEERQGQQKVFEDTRTPQKEHDSFHAADVAVKAPRGDVKDGGDILGVQKKSKEAHSPSRGLPLFKKGQGKSLGGISLKLSIEKQRDGDGEAHVKRQLSPLPTATMVHENHNRGMEVPERRPRTEEVPSSVNPAGRKAPSRAVEKPHIEQKNQFDEKRDAFRRDFRAYRRANKDYVLACSEYEAKRLILSKGEDPSYTKYAGKHSVKVKKTGVVDGKPTAVVVEEERYFMFLTPPSHQQLEPWARDVVKSAERTLRLKRKLEKSFADRYDLQPARVRARMAQIERLEEAVFAKTFLLEDHTFQGRQPHQLVPPKAQADSQSEAISSTSASEAKFRTPTVTKSEVLTSLLPKIDTFVPAVPTPKSSGQESRTSSRAATASPSGLKTAAPIGMKPRFPQLPSQVTSSQVTNVSPRPSRPGVTTGTGLKLVVPPTPDRAPASAVKNLSPWPQSKTSVSKESSSLVSTSQHRG